MRLLVLGSVRLLIPYTLQDLVLVLQHSLLHLFSTKYLKKSYIFIDLHSISKCKGKCTSIRNTLQFNTQYILLKLSIVSLYRKSTDFPIMFKLERCFLKIGLKWVRLLCLPRAQLWLLLALSMMCDSTCQSKYVSTFCDLYLPSFNSWPSIFIFCDHCLEFLTSVILVDGWEGRTVYHDIELIFLFQVNLCNM